MPRHEQRPPEDRPRFRWLKNPPENPPPGPLGIHDWSARTRALISAAAIVLGGMAAVPIYQQVSPAAATVWIVVGFPVPFLAIAWIWKGD